jgi:hypothetical protein
VPPVTSCDGRHRPAAAQGPARRRGQRVDHPRGRRTRIEPAGRQSAPDPGRAAPRPRARPARRARRDPHPRRTGARRPRPARAGRADRGPRGPRCGRRAHAGPGAARRVPERVLGPRTRRARPPGGDGSGGDDLVRRGRASRGARPAPQWRGRRRPHLHLRRRRGRRRPGPGSRHPGARSRPARAGHAGRGRPAGRPGSGPPRRRHRRGPRVPARRPLDRWVSALPGSPARLVRERGVHAGHRPRDGQRGRGRGARRRRTRGGAAPPVGPRDDGHPRRGRGRPRGRRPRPAGPRSSSPAVPTAYRVSVPPSTRCAPPPTCSPDAGPGWAVPGRAAGPAGYAVGTSTAPP